MYRSKDYHTCGLCRDKIRVVPHAACRNGNEKFSGIWLPRERQQSSFVIVRFRNFLLKALKFRQSIFLNHNIFFFNRRKFHYSAKKSNPPFVKNVTTATSSFSSWRIAATLRSRGTLRTHDPEVVFEEKKYCMELSKLASTFSFLTESKPGIAVTTSFTDNFLQRVRFICGIIPALQNSLRTITIVLRRENQSN